ncbi:MAG TPA: hypothetical protein VFR37_25400 [Longimicrobium sp.]|nr:hypothetical protein [Longimicrobium sp.]
MKRLTSPFPGRASTLALSVMLLGAIAAPLYACTIIPVFWVREEQQPALVLEALRDSVYVGTFVPERYDPRAHQARLVPAEAKRAYGQPFRVREVVARGEGLPAEVRPGARVVVLNWGLGASCGAEAPARAYSAPPGHQAFVLPARRPMPASASWQPARRADAPGLPVLEISPHEQVYVARYHRSQRTTNPLRRLFHPRPMTVREYAAMYRAMPGRQEWLRDPRGMAQRVARWGQANPGLARREPARTMVQHLDYMVERMESEAAGQRGR